jgi:hypothetical protein
MAFDSEREIPGPSVPVKVCEVLGGSYEPVFGS